MELRPRPACGSTRQFDIKQYPLGTAFETFADGCASSQIPRLKNRVGPHKQFRNGGNRNPAQHFIAAVITNATTHALEFDRRLWKPLRLGAVAVKRHQNGPVGLVV